MTLRNRLWRVVPVGMVSLLVVALAACQALTVVPRIRQRAIAAAVASAGLCLRANLWNRYMVVGGQARTGSSER